MNPIIQVQMPDRFTSPDGTDNWRYEYRKATNNEHWWDQREARWHISHCEEKTCATHFVAIPKKKLAVAEPSIVVGRAFGEANGDVSFAFPKDCLPGPGRWCEVAIRVEKVVGESK